MATETAEFKVVVDGGMAQKALDDVRNRALGLGGGLDRVVGGLDKLGGKSGADAEKAVRSLSFALGSAGGRASEALGVLGDIAGALSGGGLAIGLTAAAAAGTYAWTKYEEALAEIAANGGAVDDTVKRLLGNFTDASNARLASAAASAKQLADAVATFGKSPQQLAIDNVIARQIEAEDKLAKLRRERNRLETDTIPAAGVLEVLSGKITKLEAERTQLERDGIEARENFARYNALVEGEKARQRAEADAAKAAAAEQKAFEDQAASYADFLEQAQTQRQRDYEAASQQRHAFDTAQQEAAERAHATLEKTEKEHQERLAALQRDAQEKNLAEVQGYATQAVGIAAGATASLVSDLISGQRDAFAAFASSVFEQAGTALIGHGINAAGGGLAQLALSGGAKGGESLAVGLGLIGGGIALGAVAPAVVGQLTGGFGGGEVPTSLAAARDPGVNLPSSGAASSSEVAPITVVFEYGVGPTPERMARDLARATRYARTHRILDEGRR